MVTDSDGSLLLIGRYRSGGDSRTGLKAGTRGRALTLFRSADGGDSFQPIRTWKKPDVAAGSAEVLSIEGACLCRTDDGYQIFISSEKASGYPQALLEYQKPGAGVWSIDVMRLADLQDDVSARPLLSENSAGHLHLKDPFLWGDVSGGPVTLGFCSHPFCWSSSNTGVADLSDNATHVKRVAHEVFPRGTTWDVAMMRATCTLAVPRVGEFADRSHTIVFYCGGECVRPLDEHQAARHRPRGYSCEEIGGALVYVDKNPATAERLSDVAPLFVSPCGTGCSRYVDVLAANETYYATWQQSQDDLSQPLVMHHVDQEAANALLRD